MINEYKDEVFLAYQKKKESGDISINLLRPTPGKLRAECLSVYKERFIQKDENTIKAFFGPKGDSDNYLKCIDKFETQKFKPLKNFLTKKTSDPDEKIIHLVAWLIDHEPRPYQMGGIRIENVDTNAGGRKTETGRKLKILTPPGPPDAGKAGNWKQILSTPKMKQIIASLMIFIFAGSGAYLFLNNINQQCMYWTGDHYEAVSCNQKIKDVTIIAMDNNIASRLKKITRPDTLTQNAVGKVWYTKIDNELEFYTSSGYHPEYTDRKLKPITAYIIDKYIKNDNIAE